MRAHAQMTRQISCDECATGTHRFMATLSSETLARLDCQRVERSLSRGAVLFRQGEQAEWIYCVSDAIVKLTRETPSGRKTIVGIQGAGSLLGLPGAFGDGTYPYTAEVVQAGTCCEIRSAVIVQAAEKSGAFARQLLDLVSREASRTARQAGLATGPKLAPKLAALLLDLSRSGISSLHARAGGNGNGNGSHGDNGHARIEGLTRQDLARMCAVSNEALVRCLTTFRADGVVEANGRTIKILDPHRLEQLSRMA